MPRDIGQQNTFERLGPLVQKGERRRRDAKKIINFLQDKGSERAVARRKREGEEGREVPVGALSLVGVALTVLLGGGFELGKERWAQMGRTPRAATRRVAQ